MSRPGPLRARLAFLPVRLAIGLTRLLPYRARPAAGARLMRVVVAIVPSLRRRVENNLRLVLPEFDAAARRDVRREMADNFGRTFLEILDNPRFHASGDWTAPDGPGAEAIRAAFRDGTGAVIVTGHFGQWEAGRAWMCAEGITCAGVYRPLDNPHLNAIYLANLEAGGEPIFAKNRAGVRGMVRHVAARGIVAILTDQYERRARPLDFLGQPAPTALVPAELALKFRVPLIPLYGIRQPDRRHVRVVVEEPIPHSTAPQMMQAVNDSLAARIRAHPGQYYWLHRRWVKDFG